MFIRAYLRASTTEQDATRAKSDLEAFAANHGVVIATSYVENASGAKLARPELFRLIGDAHKGDVLLIEQVDRLTRLEPEDWEALKAAITAKGLCIVSLDLPTSWAALKPTRDDLTAAVLKAVNQMMLDLLAAFARKDYDDRRRRQAQGIATAKADGKYKGRPEDVEKNAHVRDLLLTKKFSWEYIITNAKVSRATVAKVAKRINDDAQTS